MAEEIMLSRAVRDRIVEILLSNDARHHSAFKALSHFTHEMDLSVAETELWAAETTGLIAYNEDLEVWEPTELGTVVHAFMHDGLHRQERSDHQCLQGTAKLPKAFEPCCEIFEAHTRTCVYDLRYEYSDQHGWGIRLADEVGGGQISIAHCPHCGLPLQAGRTDDPYA